MILRKLLNKARPGTAAVELAVVLPFLALIFVIALDWARIFYYTITINDCARNGAEYLSDPNGAATSPYANYTAASLAGTNLTPTPNVNSSNGSDAQGSYVEVTVSYTFKTITNFPGVPSNTNVQRTIRMYVAPRTPSST